MLDSERLRVAALLRAPRRPASQIRSHRKPNILPNKCIYIYIYIHVYVCMYTHIFTYTHIYIYTYIQIYLYTYIITYIHIHVCIYIYIYIHKWGEREREIPEGDVPTADPMPNLPTKIIFTKIA